MNSFTLFVSRYLSIFDFKILSLFLCRYSTQFYQMTNFFDIKHTFLKILGYEMSHLEFWATLTGLVAVILSARGNIWSWIIGLVNVVLAFMMFYQKRLYPDTFLQVFFFITNLIGWWQWKFPKSGEGNKHNELKITKLSQKEFLYFTMIGMIGTALLGSLAKNLNELMPMLFQEPSAFPYIDSFTTVMSIFATFLLIRKKVEAWWVWLAVDVISTYVYNFQDIKVYALLYFIFCIIALVGAISWTKEFRKKNQ
jgi:nicotinamide mononucleotide transporter